MNEVVDMELYREQPDIVDTNAKIGLNLWLEWFEIDAITNNTVKTVRIMDYRERMYRLKDAAIKEVETIRTAYEAQNPQ